MDVVMLFVYLAALLIGAIPAYVVAKRRDLKNPKVAFVPVVGVWIVLLEATGKSGWNALIVLIPTIGALVLWIWTARQIPVHHGRSRWWTLAFLIPGLNLIAYWAYAFTLEHATADAAVAY